MVPAEFESGVEGEEDRGWLTEVASKRRVAGATRLPLETHTPFRALDSAMGGW